MTFDTNGLKSLKRLSPELVSKYNISCPYYTSYPVLSRWSPEFKEKKYLEALEDLAINGKDLPLTLYIHFPFCPKLCYYCLCNVQVTKNRDRIRQYLEYLAREIDLLCRFFEKHNYRPIIREIHLGGGSPSYLNEDELDFLWGRMKALVDEKNLREFAIEIDARSADPRMMTTYPKYGINRISLGIQDFDIKVQKAVNRQNTPEFVDELLSPEVRKTYRSINFDLLYGLPLQNRESFRNTIESVKRLSPDRISLYKYAHMPDIRKHQKLINDADIPALYEKTMCFVDSIVNLVESGYEYIGIDHFAKQDDSLAKANREKTLTRNFIGYRSGDALGIIGLGITSTCGFRNYYAQRTYSIEDYYKAVDNGMLPVHRGYELSQDDLIRNRVINRILCNYSIDFNFTGHEFGIDFREYFKEEIALLNRFVDDGILILRNDGVDITPVGRIFIYHICRVFDTFLKNVQYKSMGP